jgi:hypothetical protein
MYELRREMMGSRTVRMVMAGLMGRERWALWKWTTLVMDSCKLNVR